MFEGFFGAVGQRHADVLFIHRRSGMGAEIQVVPAIVTDNSRSVFSLAVPRRLITCPCSDHETPSAEVASQISVQLLVRHVVIQLSSCGYRVYQTW